ncbi:Pimeloyl-ACP methyl ester carboxylesterase [Hymenobacter daecheongensis DSM 21074]|uniref:Pimeloyl-ACP methyl ester carboxylesterase n=1 Tax=Hymenobacter daecheongensis DSM 21074 TaxID=1121955 RepID=A0A1M6HLV1_9BACT|nr:alpha/beta fold hydrolase [Hymenobacter daecheongensis]SHJ23171.1 Pimeloyl-ACP methyl ester carboxylesterase [Hymenobacter daecheongensis DSM 21074]
MLLPTIFRLLLLGLLLLPGLGASAQTLLLLEGQVLDEAHHAPVPFATLGIPGQPLGTVADAEGRFRFLVPAALADEADRQLVVSCVGYAPAPVALAAFRAGRQVVGLRPVPVALGGVTVRPGRVRTKTFGRTGATTFMTARLYTEPDLVRDELGREQGTLLRLDPDCRLRAVRFHVAFNRFQWVRFRLNLYRVKDGRPDQLLPLPQDITFEVRQPRGWVTVDLSPYNIQVQGQREIVVALQWLQSAATAGSAKAFALSAVPTPGHSIVFRDKSQDRWRDVRPGHLSLHLTADSYATPHQPKNTTPASEPEYALPDSLKYLQFVEQPAPGPPPSHHYGDSAAVGHYVAVRGAKLYYEEYGQGEPLLLLHGNGQSIAAFHRQIGPLARHFRVIAVDTRAQGRSADATTGPLSYDLFAADLRQLLAALHLPRVRVLGWSDGGNTALKLALADPALVQRMAIMGANLFPTEQALAPGVLAGIRQHLHAVQTRLPADSAARTQARLLRLLLEEPQLTFGALAAIKVPTLVLAGQYDMVREAHTRALAQAIGGARLTIFAGASHNAPQETPALFNQTVLDFLLAP